MDPRWNLDPKHIIQMELVQISMIPQSTEIEVDSEEKRLIILCHFLAANGIPALYLSKPPDYMNSNTNSRVVMVFDMDQKLRNIDLPYYVDTASTMFDFHRRRSKSMMFHFKRALTLVLLYKYFKYKPIYMTSYIIIPEGDDEWPGPIIVRHDPVILSDGLAIRTLVLGDIGISFRVNMCICRHNYILVSPYEQPFYVANLLQNNTLECKYLNGSTYRFSYSDEKIMILLDPPPYLSKLYKGKIEMPKAIPNPRLNQNIQIYNKSFRQYKVFHISMKEIDEFFRRSKTLETKEPEKQEEPVTDDQKDDIFIEIEPSIEDIISEFIIPHEVYGKLVSILDKYYLVPFDQHIPMMGNNPVLLSMLSFTVKIRSILSPDNFYNFTVFNNISRCIKLEVPTLCINQNGSSTNIPANDLFKFWENERLQPISGKKECFLVIIADRKLNHERVLDYKNNLQHVYNLYGLGTLRDSPKYDSPILIEKDYIEATISSMTQEDKLIEFRNYPLMVIVLSDIISDIKHNLYIKFVMPNSNEMQPEGIRSTAFVIYTLIRIHSNANIYGYKTIANMSKYLRGLLDYRYQPAYILLATSSDLVLHLAWEPRIGHAVIIDECGTMFANYEEITEAKQISDIYQEIESFMKPIQVTMIIVILGEGLTQEQLTSYKQFLPRLQVYTIAPMPSIQTYYQDIECRDIFVFSSYEYSESEDIFQHPIETGFVISKKYTSYMINLYQHEQFVQPKDAIIDYAKQISNLSWLSIKPDFNERATAFPPHIAALLQTTKTDLYKFTPLDFLPFSGLP